MVNPLKKYFTKSISFNYKWTIANFSQLYDEGHQWKWRICSDEFSAPNNEELQFEIYLYPKGNREKFNDFITIGVCPFDIPKSLNVGAQWNVSIEDANGEKCETKECKNYRLCCKIGKTLQFIEHKQLLNCASKYLPNDQLTLHLEIHLQDRYEKRIFNLITNNLAGHSRFDCANKVTKVEHTWTVENFADMFKVDASPNRINSKEVTPYFVQSEFPALEEQRERFGLRLCPNRWCATRNDCVDIFVWNNNEYRATVHTKMTIPFADSDYIREEIWNIPAKYGRHFTLHQQVFLNEENGLVDKNNLKIHCEMSYMMGSTEDKPNQSETKIKLTTNQVNNPSVQGITININNSSGVVINILSSNSMNDFKVNES